MPVMAMVAVLCHLASNVRADLDTPMITSKNNTLTWYVPGARLELAPTSPAGVVPCHGPDVEVKGGQCVPKQPQLSREFVEGLVEGLFAAKETEIKANVSSTIKGLEEELRALKQHECPSSSFWYRGKCEPIPHGACADGTAEQVSRSRVCWCFCSVVACSA